MTDGLRIEVNVHEHMLELFVISVMHLGQRKTQHWRVGAGK